MKYFLSVALALFSVQLCAQNLSGDWGYAIDGRQITLYGDKIENNNYSGRSGTLKVALWASDRQYNGGTINGYQLYEIQLDPLDAGYYYHDISNTGYCSYPPDGGYYLTILLLEYNNGFEIVDHLSMKYTRF